MRSPFRRMVFVAVASALALSVCAADALAGPPWTVTSGTQSTGTVTSIASATGTPESRAVFIRDVTDNVTFTCVASSANTAITLGSAVANPVGHVNSSTWSKCTGPLGISISVAQVGSWGFNATASTGTTSITGFLDNVKLNLSGTCTLSIGAPGSASASGTADLVYTNPSGTVSGKLALSGTASVGPRTGLAVHTPGAASVCFGLVHDKAQVTISTAVGSPFTFGVSFTVR